LFDPYSISTGMFMLALLLATFTLMAKYRTPQALAMPMLACALIGIQGRHAEEMVISGFGHFSIVAVLFTAVAIPAHMIDRSQGFQWLAASAGRALGRVTLRLPHLWLPAMIATILASTFLLAATLHNVTSILIVTPIAIRLCMKYEVPSRWILSGALIASNLGGFTTRWGDTPNIIESRTWNLSSRDFSTQVFPANLLVLIVLTLTVFWLTRRSGCQSKINGEAAADSYSHPLKIALKASEYADEVAEMVVDRRLLLVGLGALVSFIVLQAFFPGFQIAIGAGIVLVATMLERSGDRLETLKSLGYEVYLVFASVFLLARCVESSWIGSALQEMISRSHAAPWAIAVTGAVGTSFTEAASWATAAAARIYPLDPSHTAAWALGSGICAGSSAIVTAASAGIILCNESLRFKDSGHEITFRKYLPFGLAFALAMLIIYIIYFSILNF